MEALTLIIIEDEDTDFELMKRAIRKEYGSATVYHFPDPLACLARLDEINPDAIIADYRMPRMDGLGLLDVLKREQKNIPVIMITAQGDVNVAVKAMKLGAWDYLVKSGEGFSMIPGILGKVVRERDLRNSLRESERLNRMLLDALPHPAMLIKRNRKIVGANPIAQEAGAKIGGCCWRDFSLWGCISEEHKKYLEEHPDDVSPHHIKCAFCLADEALAGNGPANDPEIKALGRLWDMWWIPIDGETFLHYGVDITNRRISEERIRDLTRLLIRAQEGGRKKLAYDLHDTIGQDLSSLKIGIDTLLDDQPDELHMIQDRLRSLSDTLEQTIRTVRDLAYNLRPPTLDELGLARTIYQYCEEFSATHGIKVDFHSAGMDGVKLDLDTSITLYRLIQEGLNNVRKHADATRVCIKLVASYPRIILRIEDNGKGFEVSDGLVATLNKKCLGLRGMEERVALLDGEMRIESRPMQGTSIRIEVPYGV